MDVESGDLLVGYAALQAHIRTADPALRAAATLLAWDTAVRPPVVATAARQQARWHVDLDLDGCYRQLESTGFLRRAAWDDGQACWAVRLAPQVLGLPVPAQDDRRALAAVAGVTAGTWEPYGTVAEWVTYGRAVRHTVAQWQPASGWWPLAHPTAAA